MVNIGFQRKRESDDDSRLPPGQYQTDDFPVLSLGPTPQVDKKDWKLRIWGLADEMELSWEDVNKMSQEQVFTDIHCVTKWSKFDTEWTGVPFEQIMKKANVDESATHVIAHSADGYTTNLPIDDLVDGKGFVAIAYDGDDITPQHGGPARLFVPRLYFWKSAKWLNGLEFLDHDEPGFWETRGYHNYGDPWKEQRYDGD